MNPVVFDTSVALKWFFPENGQKAAISLKDKHLEGEINLCTRDLFLYELTSSLKNYSSTKIKGEDFLEVIKAVESMGLIIFPLEFKELGQIFSLARELNLSIYDCSFLVLAKDLNAPFYTADKKLYFGAQKILKEFFLV